LAAARADAESAYRIAREINFPLYMSESARRLAGVYAARGDHRSAYQMSIEAADMSARGAVEKSGRACSSWRSATKRKPSSTRSTTWRGATSSRRSS
jgi:hypothetical protein